MSIDALTQAKSTLEGVRGALGIYSKTEVDMTLGMLDRAIAKYIDLDAICQDLQEKTYTQAMRIAELEAKLAEAAVAEQHKKQEQGEPVAIVDANDDGYWADILPDRSVKVGQLLYTTPQQRKPLTDEQIDKAIQSAGDALLDHIYEYGTAAEGVTERIRAVARAIEAAHGIKGEA